jgi:hypothetical protein
LAQGRRHEAGSVPRVPAPEIEGIVLKALREANESAEKDLSERELVDQRLARVVVRTGRLELSLSLPTDAKRLDLPWSAPASRRKRAIVGPPAEGSERRPMRAEARARLLAAIARKARLHQKVATTSFFESNGGQAKAEATLPEIRLAVAEPDLDVGNVETAIEALSTSCYYLSAEKNRYRFSLSPNLNKLLADRGASVQSPRVEERVRAEVQKVFAEGKGVIDRIFFPDKSGQIPDVARLTLIVLRPDHAAADKATRSFVDAATKEHGSSARTFKSGLVWAVPEGADSYVMTLGKCLLGKHPAARGESEEGAAGHQRDGLAHIQERDAPRQGRRVEDRRSRTCPL